MIIKLVLANVFVILATSSVFAQAASPKDFEKLNKMYDGALTPKNLDQVLVERKNVRRT